VNNVANNFSFIDKGLTVEGNISSQGKLIIRGTVKGHLNGETVIIAEEGAVYANTQVSSLTVGGTFEGDIRASDELVILSTGQCSGRVTCKDLVIEAEGVINAQVWSITIQEHGAEENLPATAES
jgi:cytoskeletal protein CcmA (bactofilin family)